MPSRLRLWPTIACKGNPMDSLAALAETIAVRLKESGDTLAVAESSTGGLISAALLAVPGASAYFQGGAVVYTRSARRILLGIEDAEMKGIRSASAGYATLLARTVRERFGTTWGLAETGATGPTGNGYGDPPGHVCLAIAGPVEKVVTIETGHAERLRNMRDFAEASLGLFGEALASA